MEKIIKKIFFFSIIINCILGQNYNISVFNIPVAEVKQIFNNQNTIEYEARSVGIIDMIWPTKNFYSCKFDSNNYGIRGWRKNIKQGDYKKKTHVDYNPETSELIYDSNKKVPITEYTQNIFTLLAMVQKTNYVKLDAHWFKFEHNGQLGKARFLWADSINVNYGENTILCDHYRLDIILDNDSNKLQETSDYFMSEIISPSIIRQLWVSRESKKRIIQTSVDYKGLTILALIDE